MANMVNFGGLVLDTEWFPFVDVRDPEKVFVQDRNDGEWRFEDAEPLDAPVCAAIRAWAAGLGKVGQEPMAELIPIWHSIYDLYSKVSGLAPEQEAADKERDELRARCKLLERIAKWVDGIASVDYWRAFGKDGCMPLVTATEAQEIAEALEDWHKGRPAQKAEDEEVTEKMAEAGMRTYMDQTCAIFDRMPKVYKAMRAARKAGKP